MARKPKEPEIIDVDAVKPEVADALTSTAQQMAEHTNHIMATFGDGQLYERNRVVNEARFFMAQSAEAMLEAGKRLVIIKEHEPHGDFETIVRDQLGIPERTAQRMMQSAIKYLSPKLESKAPALALLGKTKLFELMVEDDEELASLADGGTVAGLTLDDIDRMTSRELRIALREAKEKDVAKDQVIADKTKKITDLDVQLRRERIKKITPDEEAAAMRKEIAAIQGQIEELVRVQLAGAFDQFMTYIGEQNLSSQDDFLAAQLDLLDKALVFLRRQSGIERTTSVSTKPEWDEE